METQKPALGSKILAYLMANGPSKTSKLRDCCRAPATEIKAACDALASSGDLVGLKSGHLYIWALPEHVDQVAAQIRSAMASRQTEDIPRLIRSIASNAAKRDFAWAVFDEMYAGCSIPMEA